MRFRMAAGVGVLLLTPPVLSAQDTAPAADSPQVLLLEHRFGTGSADSVVVTLEHRVMYWAEVTGPGTPAFQPLRRYGWSALVVPLDEGRDDRPRRFEVHPAASGPHLIALTDLAQGSAATLRVYRDEIETRRFAESHDRDFAVGLLLGIGVHTGYRLDPTGATDPVRGGDVEGCLMAQSGGGFGACIGVARQRLPDADLSVTWFFLEPRMRIVSGRLMGDLRTDLGAALRLGQAPETGPRHISPSLIAIGLHVTQHLAPGGRRRGWSVYAAWHHGWLGNIPEPTRRETNLFTAGLTWVP